MSTFADGADHNRRLQDGFERHVFSEMEYVLGGQGIVKLKGTGTEDEEAHLLNMGGVGGRFPKDTNMEVFLHAGGADTSLKFAQWDVPRDKKRPWKEGFNGLQAWDNPDRALQFGKKRAHLIDEQAAIGKWGNFELDENGDVWIRPKPGRKIYSEVEIVVRQKDFKEE